MPERLARQQPGVDLGEVTDAVLTASRALVAVAARSLAAAGEDVSLAQYRVLVLLAAQGPQRLADVADALAVVPSTATRVVDRLVRKHLVRRHREANDRRQVRITLTPTGRGLVEAVTASRRREIARLVAAVPAKDRQILVAALRAFTEAAREVPDSDWALGWA